MVNLEDKSEPRYICLLCEKRGDPRSVMVHVTSQNHFLKYISCFFRTVGNILNLTKVTPENKKGYSIAVRKIGAEIEKHYGRLKPTSAAAETFSQKKYEILKAIDEKEHFRETPATTFVHLATPEMIAKFNEEEEDELLKPILRPLEELKSQSSLGALEKQQSRNNDRRDWISKMAIEKRPSDRSESKSAKEKDEKKFSFQIGEPKRSLGTQLSDDKNNSKKDPDIVVIEDDPADSKSLSPISSHGSVGGRPRRLNSRERSRSLGRDRMRRDRDRVRKRSPQDRRQRRTRSRTRSPRRDVRHRRESPPRRIPIDRRRDRRDYSPDRRPREFTPERRGRDFTPDRRRDRELDDRRRREFTPDRLRASDDRYERRRRDSRDRSPYRERERDMGYDNRRRSPHHSSLDRRDDKKRKWDEYRSELNKLEIEAEKKLKQYEARPEKHPLYNEEWKAFWNKRYKEVQADGRDPNTYDFKPEWIVYWGKRMREINDEEFRLRGEELKMQFKVTMDDVKGPSNDLVDISPPTSEDGREVTIEDIKNTWKGLTGTELSGPPAAAPPPKRRSPSPWEMEPQPFIPPVYVPPVVENRSHVLAPPTIHCLRLLSVIEHHLGSLGPRVLELLSKALVLERQGQGKSMTLLEEPEVHVLFDTVKEKIRGALMAYVIERHLVNHCRMVINTVEKMLSNHPPKEKPSLSDGDLFKPTIAPPKTVMATTSSTNPLAAPGISVIDKMAIAQQIAGALIAQGRTDVSQEELEALINAVVGIARASNVAVNQNTTSLSFFSQLNMKTSTATAHINSILSSMIKDVTGKAPVMPEELIEPQAQPKNALEDELKEKLTKFNSLSRDEQQSLISILKELEKTDPKKVENLRKYVSVGLTKKDETSDEGSVKKETSKPETMKRPIDLRSDDDDDDDDDYSYEDVYKAATEKLKTETNKKLATQSSLDLNSDSNLSRASASNPPGVVASEKPRSDFSDVFGPQRNPAGQGPAPATSSNSFKFDPKNSAPDVTDPNSQMSLDDGDDTHMTSSTSGQDPSKVGVSISGLSAADSRAVMEGFNLQNVEIPTNLLNFDTRASYMKMKEPDSRPLGNFGVPDQYRHDSGFIQDPPQYSGIGTTKRGPMPVTNFGRDNGPPGGMFDNGPPATVYGRGNALSYGRDNGPPVDVFGRDGVPSGNAYSRDQGPPVDFDREQGPLDDYSRDQRPPGDFGRSHGPPSDYGRDHGPPGDFGRDTGFLQYGGPPQPRPGSFNGGPSFNSGPPPFGGPNFGARPSLPNLMDGNPRNRFFPRNY